MSVLLPFKRNAEPAAAPTVMARHSLEHIFPVTPAQKDAFYAVGALWDSYRLQYGDTRQTIESIKERIHIGRVAFNYYQPGFPVDDPHGQWFGSLLLIDAYKKNPNADSWKKLSPAIHQILEFFDMPEGISPIMADVYPKEKYADPQAAGMALLIGLSNCMTFVQEIGRLKQEGVDYSRAGRGGDLDTLHYHAMRVINDRPALETELLVENKNQASLLLGLMRHFPTKMACARPTFIKR